MADDWATETVQSNPAPPPAAGNVDDWAKPAQAADTSGPMPGIGEAAVQGIKRGLGDVGQSVTLDTNRTPETSPAASDFEWRDLAEPIGRGAPKVAYRFGQSSPTVAAGVAGGAAGSLVYPGVGTAIGGVGGAAAGAALQTIGPSFAAELKQSPNDPDGAWTRAVEHGAVSGAFSGAGWALFPAKFFEGPVKQLAFQAFGVQPGVAVAEQATQNAVSGKPLTENLGKAYVEGAVGTTVPMAGHMALKGRFGEPASVDPGPTPQNITDMARDKLDRAQEFDTLANDPNTSPVLAQQLTGRADRLRDAALFDNDRLQAPARMQQKLAQADQLDQQAQTAPTPADAAQLQQQSRALRRDADYDGFIAHMPPPMPKREGAWGKFKDTWINNIQPELASDTALKVDPVFANFKSKIAQVKDSLIASGEKYYYKFNKMPDAERIDYMRAIETGSALPADLVTKYPWLPDAARAQRNALDLAYRMEQQMGSRSAFVEDYFPHIWKKPKAARDLMDQGNIAQSMGGTWFQKSRYYDLIDHGLANGLELKNTNPQELVTSRLLSGVDMMEKVRLLHELERNGVAVPQVVAPYEITNPGRNNPNPWSPVNGPDGSRWLIAPDAQSLWKNAVDAKGLWADEGLIGKGFRGWMKYKNFSVPIKLGLSLFHPVHVFHINVANNMSRALHDTFGSGQQGVLRRATALPEAAFQSVADAFMALPIGTPFKGKTMRDAWLTEPSKQTPAQQAMVKMMNEAGVSGQLSEQLKIAAKRNLSDAWNNSEYHKALPNLGRRMMEVLSAPIFEHWIPNLKMAAVAREAESLFRRRPDLVDDPVQRRVAMRALGKEVENRFGEMFYGGLFWNRTFKDSLIGSFLSLGWNLGFVREFGGGALEPLGRRLMDPPSPTRKTIRDTAHKTTNAVVYMMSAMAVNAMINKSMTGDNPQGMDYIFPRIGGLNPDGSPRRITNPFYTREVPMAGKNIEERQSVVGGLAQMLYHKMMFAPVVEMGSNRDYFGYQIYDPNAPGYKQMWQFFKHYAEDNMMPMSVSGAKRSLQLSGKPIPKSGPEFLQSLKDPDVIGPLMGFGPAPSYASKSPMENRIGHLFQEHVSAETKPFEFAEQAKLRADARTEYMGAIQRKDQPAIEAAAMKLAQLGVTTKQMAKTQPGETMLYMYSRLPWSDQKALLKDMQPDEFKRYFVRTGKKAKADPEVLALAQKYFKQ